MACLKRVLRYQYCGLIIRSCSSALYVTGDKATETYSVLTPHLDFNERLKNITELKQNLDFRGMNVNIVKLKEMWDFMKIIEANKFQLEQRRVEVADKMKHLKSLPIGEYTEKETGKLRIEGKMIRDDLKEVTKSLWEVEGDVVIQALALPNDLHADTPSCAEKLIHEFGTKSDASSESHLKKGIKLDIIKYFNQLNYYLLGDAASFELGAMHYFSEVLENSGMVQFSNTDFARSVIVEGVGMKHKDPLSTIILKSENEPVNDDDRLHLVGGATLASFCAFHTKHSVKPYTLPAKYYSIGRQYNPQPKNTNAVGLLNVWQASAVKTFIATSDSVQMEQEFNALLQKLILAYESLGVHFRVVYLPAKALKPWDSLRASFQLFSSHSHSYIEVGNISLSGDYISKRLLMVIQPNEKAESKFMNLVSGTAVSVPKLLACILEQYNDDILHIPQPIKQHMLQTQ